MSPNPDQIEVVRAARHGVQRERTIPTPGTKRPRMVQAIIQRQNAAPAQRIVSGMPYLPATFATSKGFLDLPLSLFKHNAALLRNVYSEGMETVEATGHLTPELLAEFEANAKRPLETRMRYAFLRTYKPVLDDARYRSFDTMEEYRRWCNENLPDWLGYRTEVS